MPPAAPARLASAALFALVPLGVLTGCGSEESADSGSTTRKAAPASTAPALKADTITAVTSAGTALKPPAKAELARIEGLAFRFVLEGTAVSQGEIMTDEGPVQAGKGRELLLFKYSVEGELGDHYLDARPQQLQFVNSVALIVDERRTVLDSDALIGTHETAAVSVPSNARKVELEFNTGEVTQTLSLRTAQRTGTYPALWYREDVLASDLRPQTGGPFLGTEVTERLSFPFTLREPDGTVSFEDKYPTVIDIDSAELSYTLTAENGELIHPTGPDRAFLTLSANVTGGNSWKTAMPTKNFVVTTPDGTKIAAKRFDDPRLGSDISADFFGGELYWDVPADLSAATISFKATSNHNMGGLFNSRTLDYHNVTKSVDIQF